MLPAQINITLFFLRREPFRWLIFLIQTGISSERLNYRGYGNASPVGDNVTTEGRKLNRRTEVKIIEYKK